MPIMDAQLLLCESMSIAKNAGQSTTSTNSVYIPKPVDHKGVSMTDRPNESGRLYWNCVVEDTDLLAAVDGSVITFELFNHTAIDAVASGTAILSKVITENTPSEHKDGTLLFSIPLPAGQVDPYFEMKASIATQNLSAGAVTSWIGGPVQAG